MQNSFAESLNAYKYEDFVVPLKVIQNPIRVKILGYIARSPDLVRSNRDIAAALGFDINNESQMGSLSNHIRPMILSGFLTSTKNGHETDYKIDMKKTWELLEFLENVMSPRSVTPTK